MPSNKRISSIAQSTAHHAVSGVCYVNPHLKRACTTLNRSSCRIDLLAAMPCPPEFRDIDPIRLSISALQATFVEIAKAEGFAITDFKEAVLCYEFPMQLDDYSSNCSVSIISNPGYSVTRAVDYAGKGAEIIYENTEPTDAAAASRGQ